MKMRIKMPTKELKEMLLRRKRQNLDTSWARINLKKYVKHYILVIIPV